MRNNRRITQWITGVALAVGTAYTAQAGLSQLNIGYYNTFGVSLSAQGYGHSTYATAFSADRVGGALLPVPHTDPFVTFCLDINNNLGNGYWQSGGFSDTPLNNDSNPANRSETGLYRAASLYAKYSSGIMNPDGTFAAQTGTTTDGIYSAREKGGALQLAIWEVLYDTTGTYSVNADANPNNNTTEFYVTSVAKDVRDLANTMLASQWNFVDLSLETTFWNAVNANGTYRSSQDLIGPMQPVPEPSTYIAAALLGLPILVNGLRILRKRRA